MPDFLEVLGLDEEPLGLFYTDQKPVEGFSPKPIDLPTREKETRNEINWQAVFGGFSCAIGHIWRARKKKTAAYFSAEQFGCPGAAFWLGFNKPQTETIINYVSTGIPNWAEGERYCDSPDALRRIFEHVDPRSAPKSYCVVKPLSLFTPTLHKQHGKQNIMFCYDRRNPVQNTRLSKFHQVNCKDGVFLCHVVSPPGKPEDFRSYVVRGSQYANTASPLTPWL